MLLGRGAGLIRMQTAVCTHRKGNRTTRGDRMNVKQIMENFNLELCAGAKGLDREVTGGYCGDLLSDVMANSRSGSIWLTIQSHKNIMAVAVLREVAAVVLVNGHQPDEETKAKADEEGIPLLLSRGPAYQLAGELFNAGVGRPSS